MKKQKDVATLAANTIKTVAVSSVSWVSWWGFFQPKLPEGLQK